MEESGESVPGPAVLMRAMDIYSMQLESPVSPGKADGSGRVSLCAAAAIAAAGVEACYGAAGRRQFESAVVSSATKDVLFKMFEELGWDTDVCAKTVGYNDACPTEVRKESVLRLLAGGLVEYPRLLVAG